MVRRSECCPFVFVSVVMNLRNVIKALETLRSSSTGGDDLVGIMATKITKLRILAERAATMMMVIDSKP